MHADRIWVFEMTLIQVDFFFLSFSLRRHAHSAWGRRGPQLGLKRTVNCFEVTAPGWCYGFYPYL